MAGSPRETGRGLLAHVLLPVVIAIVAAGEDVGVTAIAYRLREGGRVMQLVSGVLSRQPVVDSSLPGIALPPTESDL